MDINDENTHDYIVVDSAQATLSGKAVAFKDKDGKQAQGLLAEFGTLAVTKNFASRHGNLLYVIEKPKGPKSKIIDLNFKPLVNPVEVIHLI